MKTTTLRRYIDIAKSLLVSSKAYFSFKTFAVLIVILSLGVTVNAQHTDAYTKVAFGESLPEGYFKSHHLSHTTWVLKELGSKKELAQGSGAEVYELEFDTPGKYQLVFTYSSIEDHGDECSHFEGAQLLEVDVLAEKIHYLVDEASLSDELYGGAELRNLTLTIPVEVNSLNNKSVTIPNVVHANGVGSTIKGVLSPEQQKLAPGKHLLTYRLEGMGTKKSYVSFDFEDLNGNIQAFYLLNPLK